MFDTRTMPRDCADCTTCAKAEWSVLDAEGEQRLTQIRRTAVYGEGETIFHQGDDSLGVYCVETGNLLLRQFDAFGNETDFCAIIGGETLGCRSFFADQRHAATAIALTPCRVCFVEGAGLRGLIHDYPDLAAGFLRTLARDRGPQDALLTRNPLLPARVRVINLLLILTRQVNGQAGQGALGEVEFVLPISRSQIAAMVGVRGETLSRTLASLGEEGLCNVAGRKVVIPDHQRLVREVNFELPS